VSCYNIIVQLDPGSLSSVEFGALARAILNLAVWGHPGTTSQPLPVIRVWNGGAEATILPGRGGVHSTFHPPPLVHRTTPGVAVLGEHAARVYNHMCG
jgi:hypothetical protein